MKIYYKNKKIQKQLTDPYELKKTFGIMAKKANQRMKELKAAENLEVIKTIPAARLHKLSGNRKNQFAVNISGNYRLIIEPYGNIPKKENNEIDLIKIIEITILGTDDYH